MSKNVSNYECKVTLYDPKQNVVRLTKILINVSRILKYDPKQNVVRMTKIPINVSRLLKYDPKQNTICVGNHYAQNKRK